MSDGASIRPRTTVRSTGSAIPCPAPTAPTRRRAPPARCDLGSAASWTGGRAGSTGSSRANPGTGRAASRHPYFEVRTLAARYASPFRLTALLDDPEPDVRAMVALRLPLARRRAW